MLQQIIKEMYVDPDILEELPEEQKEILFFHIRQEQVSIVNEPLDICRFTNGIYKKNLE